MKSWTRKRIEGTKRNREWSGWNRKKGSKSCNLGRTL